MLAEHWLLQQTWFNAWLPLGLAVLFFYGLKKGLDDR